MDRGHGRKKGIKLRYILLLIIILIGIYYLFYSDKFEKILPTIEIEENMYWNLKDNITFKIKDNQSLKFINSYAIVKNSQKISLVTKEYKSIQKEDTIVLQFPEAGFFQKSGKIKIIIEVVDSSLWNYFTGNKTTKIVNIQIDRKKPSIQSILSSYSIKQGGSALTIFKIKEKNLSELYLETNDNKRFKVSPFYKDGFYAALFAWPVTQEHFRIYVVAKDKAGNIRKKRVRMYFENKKYKESYIKLSKNFINSNKITNIFEDSNDNFEMKAIDKFKFINEKLREDNENKMRNFSKNFDETKKIYDIDFNRFYPQKKALAVAKFGDHRYYYYKNKSNIVSESYHLGRDMASIARAKLYISNNGVVKYAKSNGIYGKNVVVCHKMGLCSLYGHMSEILTSTGDNVIKGDIIARTGTSGLAFGDHLHFGILVQGVEVHPGDWMDPKWVKTNIRQVAYDAKKVIDQLTRK